MDTTTLCAQYAYINTIEGSLRTLKLQQLPNIEVLKTGVSIYYTCVGKRYCRLQMLNVKGSHHLLTRCLMLGYTVILCYNAEVQL